MQEEYDIKVSQLAKPLEGWRINPNEKIVKAVIKGLERCNGECPCHNESHDKKCPCSDYREKGICHCNLYVKDE